VTCLEWLFPYFFPANYSVIRVYLSTVLVVLALVHTYPLISLFKQTILAAEPERLSITRFVYFLLCRLNTKDYIISEGSRVARA